MHKKRFIAGAVCPRCGYMDRLVTYEENDDTFKECVSWGFQEKQIANVQLSELDTRVNHIEKSDDNAEPVKMIFDGLPKKDS